MRTLTVFILPLLFCTLAAGGILSCGPAQNTINLSDRVVENPADGIGHYVFALTLPTTMVPGATLPLAMEWRTVGPVDPTARYALEILLDGPDRKVYRYTPSNNTVGEYHLSNWQTYRLKIPSAFTPGEYTVAVAIENSNGQPVTLGFEKDMVYEGSFYRVAQVMVE